MYILSRDRDILDDAAAAGRNTVVVIPVNCVGVMGAGLARQFKLRYPEQARYYRNLCEQGRISMKNCRSGLYYSPAYLEESRACLFPTKNHWRDRSSLPEIRLGLEELIYDIDRMGFYLVLMPAPGCGCGGLEWEGKGGVKEMMVGLFSDHEARGIDCDIYLYGPLGGGTKG